MSALSSAQVQPGSWQRLSGVKQGDSSPYGFESNLVELVGRLPLPIFLSAQRVPERTLAWQLNKPRHKGL